LHSASEEEGDPEVPLFNKSAPSLDSEEEEEKEDEEEHEEEPVKRKAWFLKRDQPSNSQSPNPSQTKATPAHDKEQEDSVTGIVESTRGLSNT